MTQSAPPREDDVQPVVSSTESSSLKLAMRRARSEAAERSGAQAGLRSARLGRLELLQDALQPLLAQLPADVDMFDVAIVPGCDPRLFIDMIGFVEMGRDARLYLFEQDTRHGRTRIAESDSLDVMVGAVTDYVARRLLERDKALSADAQRNATRPGDIAAANDRTPDHEAVRAAERPATRLLRWAVIAFAFLIDLLGAIAFFTILGAAGWYLWNRMHGM